MKGKETGESGESEFGPEIGIGKVLYFKRRKDNERWNRNIWVIKDSFSKLWIEKLVFKAMDREIEVSPRRKELAEVEM